MTTSAMDPALDPPAVRPTGSEHELLAAWLDFHRQTLRWKCSGLAPAQLGLASAPPSTLTLHGLVRHMAEVERWWWRRVSLGQDLPQLFCTEEYPDGDFDLIDESTWEADLAAFEAEVRLAEEVFAECDLDAEVPHPFRPVGYSNRWIAQHMIEEYARHNGHADLIRERIDGATGS